MPEYYNSIIETLQKKADQAADNMKKIDLAGFELKALHDDTESESDKREAIIAKWSYEDGYEDAIREAIDIINQAIINSDTEVGSILKDLQTINYAIREAEICVERMQYDIKLMKEALED